MGTYYIISRDCKAKQKIVGIVLVFKLEFMAVSLTHLSHDSLYKLWDGSYQMQSVHFVVIDIIKHNVWQFSLFLWIDHLLIDSPIHKTLHIYW